MSKHTPGPWRRQGMIIWGAKIQRGVAKLYTTPGEPLQDNANARLIVAAPDLLEACKSVMSTNCHCEQFNENEKDELPCFRCRCEKAIAKAEGDADV